MEKGFIEKSESERLAELDKIMKANDKNAAFRWLREETILRAENIVNDFLPGLSTYYEVPKDLVNSLAKFITEIACQLKEAPLYEGQSHKIPFPIIQN